MKSLSLNKDQKQKRQSNLNLNELHRIIENEKIPSNSKQSRLSFQSIEYFENDKSNLRLNEYEDAIVNNLQENVHENGGVH